MKIHLSVMIITSILSTELVCAEMAGWTEQNKKLMTMGCAQAILEPAIKAFEARAAQNGNSNAIFPEDQIRPAAESFCSCIIQRTANFYDYQQIISQPQLSEKFISEAFSGGECSPTGILGEALKP